MNKGRTKWIKKVVISRHPKVLEMIIERYGKEKAEQMTYKQVIKACKRMWKEKAPGVEQWKINNKELEENVHAINWNFDSREF